MIFLQILIYYSTCNETQVVVIWRCTIKRFCHFKSSRLFLLHAISGQPGDQKEAPLNPTRIWLDQFCGHFLFIWKKIKCSLPHDKAHDEVIIPTFTSKNHLIARIALRSYTVGTTRDVPTGSGANLHLFRHQVGTVGLGLKLGHILLFGSFVLICGSESSLQLPLPLALLVYARGRASSSCFGINPRKII